MIQELNNINQAKKPTKRVTILGAKATTKIAELESLPEMITLISKPGGGTTGEAVKKRLPMIYHNPGVPLKWEEHNMFYGKRKGYGKIFNPNSKNATEDLVDFLTENRIHRNRKETKESKINFTQEIRRLVREDLRKRYQSEE